MSLSNRLCLGEIHAIDGQKTFFTPSGLALWESFFRRENDGKAKKPEKFLRLFIERLAATYSRRTYRTTTIGKTVFDGRVRNGIGSDHSFMATKKYLVNSQ